MLVRGIVALCIAVRRRIKTLTTCDISKKPRNAVFNMVRPNYTVSGGFGRVRNVRSDTGSFFHV